MRSGEAHEKIDAVNRQTAFPAPAPPGQIDYTLSMAVLVFLGVGVSSYPTRLPDALAEYFGIDRANDLQTRVVALLKDAWLDQPQRASEDLVEATRNVEQKMRSSCPALSDDAIRALGWNFSFQNR